MFKPVQMYIDYFLPKFDEKYLEDSAKGTLFFVLIGLFIGVYSDIKWLKLGVDSLVITATIMNACLFTAAWLIRAKLNPYLVANLSILGVTIHLLNLVYQTGGADSHSIMWILCISAFAYLLASPLAAGLWSCFMLVVFVIMVVAHAKGIAIPTMEISPKDLKIEHYSALVLPPIALWAANYFGRKVSDDALASAQHAQSEAETLSAEARQTSEHLNEIFEKSEDTVIALLKASETFSDKLQAMSSSAKSVANGVEQQASATQQITSQVAMAADITRKSTTAVQDLQASSENAASHAGTSAQAMSLTNQSMSEIKQSNENIEQATAVISDIANQTNLLALNAAIEAARAGEMGRGFAVVADEVRNLSQRSTESAGQIRECLTQSTSDVEKGYGVVKDSEATLSTIIDLVQSMSGQVNSLTHNLQETSQYISAVESASHQVSEVTQANERSANELSLSITELTDVGTELSSIAQELKALLNRS